MNIKDTPLFILLMFTLVYATIGDPDDNTWSGLYFLVNYITMFGLFLKEKSRLNRIIGISLTSSILIYIILKFFFNFTYERYYNIVPFTIAVISLYKLENK